MTENAPRCADTVALAERIAEAFHQWQYGDNGTEATRVEASNVAAAIMNALAFEQVGYWRTDVSDQCQHCEPDRLYQRWSQEPGFYYDPEDYADQPVYLLRGLAHNDGSRATDQACPECGHHLSLHDADGCGISTCDCRHSPPKDADGT